MRKLVYVLAGLITLAGAMAALYKYLIAHGKGGYVIIGISGWSIETSLVLVVTVLLFTFLAFYGAARLVFKAAGLPGVLKARRLQERVRSSQRALVSGLIESAEGNWEKAEKHLIRHAADSGVPLINYLTAARVAHSRGASEQRDEYLRLAHQIAPEAEVAVGITRAELQLSNKQFDQALESLTHLDRIAPSHATVLRLKHQLFVQMEDWEALHKLIPTLNSQKVMMETEIRLLETETYSALLRKRAESRDPARLREMWSHIPEHIRGMSGVQILYFAAMIEAGASLEIEDALRRALGQEWNQTLLVLYGCIQMPDQRQHLTTAEAWLAPHPNDPVLLRLLGKLALRAEQVAKAREYLQRSLDTEVSLEAYQLLGDLLFAQKDFSEACAFYRNGLMFASNEVVAQIEHDREGHTLAESSEAHAEET